jgi:endoglucanase
VATKNQRRWWRPAAAGTAAVILGAAGCGRDEPGPGPRPAESTATAPAPTPATRAGNPLAGRALYVDPAGDAAVQIQQWTAHGRQSDARILAKIAERPIATWVTGGPQPVRERVATLVAAAAASNQVPVLVIYHIPHRDCGSYSAGGAGTATEYRAWIREVAAGIDRRPAVVVLEPDAVPHLVDGCTEDTGQREGLLRDAVAVLKATGSATVYLDAGNPGWIADTDRLAGALKRAGVAQADGFALNVSNFVTTEENVAYGTALSDALGGTTHFVIDTSRNGAGAVEGTEIDGGPRWCNPPGRALGPAPTTDTGQARVDAFLWVKNPGDSDGACRPGEPAAGTWWPDYALDLAGRSA